MSKIIFSVVLAIHNEAENLERCLGSVNDIADEIIIVDGESSDNSVEIATRFGAKIISTSNKQNFHINKQMAMDEASGSLVLQLDADEELDVELRDFIVELKDKFSQQDSLSSFEPKAWWIKRKNYYLGRFLTKGGQYPDKVIRLYIKGYANLPQKDVHEQMSVNGQVDTAEGHLLHYSFPNFKTVVKKMNTYTSFEASNQLKSHKKVSILATISFFILKPATTFLSIFIRHKGFMDGAQGFVFALISALHHPITYLKIWELSIKK